jgi:hypothetical protein
MESWVTEKSANTESWVMGNSTNTENRVMQDSGSRKPKEGKGATPSKRLAPRWCPRGITRTQKHRLQKIRQRELAEKKEEEEQDYWFNRLRPVTKPKQTWQEKRLAKEEGDSSGEEASKVTPVRGKTTRNRVMETRSWVTVTWSREIATRNWVTATQTQVTATWVRRMTGMERSQSQWTSTWSL